MSTYDENPNYLKNCIDSVLEQTYKDFEFIIVIEPDETNIDVLKVLSSTEKRLKILRNDIKLGVAASRNRGIKEGSGKYIAIIDGDDYCDPRRFEKQFQFLENNPEITLVGTNMFLVDEDNNIIGARIYPEIHNDIKKYFLFADAVANPTLMVRRKDLEVVGLFDTDFTKSEDFELWLRLLSKGKKMYNLQEKLVYYRVPTNHNEKRGKLHWHNNYIARKRYSKAIWPLYKRFFSLFFYFIICHLPDVCLEWLLSMKIVSRIKNIRLNYS